MQLTPRYDGDPLIRLDGDPAAVGAPAIAQLRRFVDELGRLDDDQWSHETRCEGWSVRDVVVHLDSTTKFWSLSVAKGRSGEPTRYLASFDPVATPALMVAASDVDGQAALDSLATGVEAYAGMLESLDSSDWNALAESPAGHVSVSALAHHGLWDAWIHERDVWLPLGVTPTVVDDEVSVALRYAAALSPAFAVNADPSLAGTMRVTATGPNVAFAVVVADGRVAVDSRADASGADAGGEGVSLTGDAVALLDALSCRGGLDLPLPNDQAWWLDGLATVFDQA